MNRNAAWLAGVLGALGCEPAGPPSPAALATAAAEPSAAPAAVRASRAPRVKPAPARPALEALAMDGGGRLVARRRGRPVRVVMATREAPLGPRAPAAYFQIAELVAPGLAPKTTLLELPLEELVTASKEEARARRAVERARVLATGRVEVALLELPATSARAVDLADLREGRTAWSWESKLVTRDGPPAELAKLLSSYQTLLAVDHLAGNLARREVLHDPARSVVVPVEDNDVFSQRGVDGAVGEASTRLHRHLVYSASLAERLNRLERPAIERVLSRSPDRSLLVTPKQVDEILARKSSLARLIETRIRQRGRERALALP